MTKLINYHVTQLKTLSICSCILPALYGVLLVIAQRPFVVDKSSSSMSVGETQQKDDTAAALTLTKGARPFSFSSKFASVRSFSTLDNGDAKATKQQQAPALSGDVLAGSGGKKSFGAMGKIILSFRKAKPSPLPAEEAPTGEPMAANGVAATVSMRKNAALAVQAGTVAESESKTGAPVGASVSRASAAEAQGRVTKLQRFLSKTFSKELRAETAAA